MTEKVKVSREVAKAIEEIAISDAYTIFGVVEMVAHHTNKPFYNESQIKVLRDYFTDKGDGNAPTIDELIYALTVGFEVVQTPEEYLKVRIDHNRQLFKDESSKNNHWQYRYHDGFIDGALETLSILGIKIKGVNA